MDDAVLPERLFSVEWVPPPEPQPGKYVVRSLGNKFPVLHLSPDVALELYMQLGEALGLGGK